MRFIEWFLEGMLILVDACHFFGQICIEKMELNCNFYRKISKILFEVGKNSNFKKPLNFSKNSNLKKPLNFQKLKFIIFMTFEHLSSVTCSTSQTILGTFHKNHKKSFYNSHITLIKFLSRLVPLIYFL